MRDIERLAIISACFGVDLGRIMEGQTKVKPKKVKTKYDDEAILRNEIRQARKAAKRLKVRDKGGR